MTAGIKVEQASDDKLEELEVKSWSVWEKEVSEFDWFYDEREVCYLLEGEVEVETEEGTVSFGKGDMVIFPEGLECVWRIKEDVKKHYKLG
ncbi:cupin domain-containing protein [Halarsenatibacter silvermanii]|uniref:(S)-ureidoglycine aminohydrolase cupin domain-containing protein n=1 Tax=Halarsenatibacter silvermanii TaxID=321763 RepID=A0A1G9IMJ0_9FIRM|nr:cupin domain-containing protein [Halarsenatibacter silvermanii]SDL26133.1 hypothetical protein SAMN04488692_1034 [Halarsenatibacter silvermanii]